MNDEKMKNEMEENGTEVAPEATPEKKAANEAFANFLNKAADVSKKTAKSVQKGAKALSEKIKEDGAKFKEESAQRKRENKKKKLNPLTLKEYNSKKFHIPNVIKIVDDATRRDEELCKDAIGWRAFEPEGKKTQNECVEVLYLYDEAIEASGLQFVPNYTFGAIYHVDNFDRKRFINVDNIFSRAYEEKLAELEHIAYSLGAKSCSVEIQYSDSEKTRLERTVGSKNNFDNQLSLVRKNKETDGKEEVFGVTKKQEYEGEYKNRTSNGAETYGDGSVVTYFSGNDNPKRPTLKWFAQDNNIKNLIEMRCADPASIKEKTLKLSGSTTASMSRDTAIAIDCILEKAIKIRGSGLGSKKTLGINMKTERECVKETNSKLIFHVEF